MVCIRSVMKCTFLPHTSPYTGSRGPARGPGCHMSGGLAAGPSPSLPRPVMMVCGSPHTFYLSKRRQYGFVTGVMRILQTFR